MHYWSFDAEKVFTKPSGRVRLLSRNNDWLEVDSFDHHRHHCRCFDYQHHHLHQILVSTFNLFTCSDVWWWVSLPGRVTGCASWRCSSSSFSSSCSSSPSSLNNNQYVKTHQVSEGTHHYKFLVDGVWSTEETEPTVANDVGNLWNVVQVVNIIVVIPKSIVARRLSINIIWSFWYNSPGSLHGLLMLLSPTSSCPCVDHLSLCWSSL